MRGTGLTLSPRLLNGLTMTLLGLGAAMLVFAMVVHASRSARLNLREVEVQIQNPSAISADVLRASELAQTVRSAFEGTSLNQSLGPVRQQLEQLPWIRHASLRRVWPDRLLLTLETQTVVASWPDGRLLNAQGELFDPQGQRSPIDPRQLGCRLMRLDGPIALQPRVWARALALEQRLKGMGHQMEQLRLSPERSWQLELTGGLLIELGREALEPDADQRLTAMLGSLDWLRKNKSVGSAGEPLVLDLRYARGYAVRPTSAQALSSGRASGISRASSALPICPLQTPRGLRHDA